MAKKYDILDANNPKEYDSIYKIINDYMGTNYGAWMKGIWPKNNGNGKFRLWFPKLSKIKDGKKVSVANKCINYISDDGTEFVFDDLKNTESDMNKKYLDYDLIFAKEPDGPYLFRGVFVRDMEKSKPNHDVSKRIATKVRTIGDPVKDIEIIDEIPSKVMLNDILELTEKEIEKSKIEMNLYNSSNNEAKIDEWLKLSNDEKCTGKTESCTFWSKYGKTSNYKQGDIVFAFMRLNEDPNKWLFVSAACIVEVPEEGHCIVMVLKKYKEYFGRLIIRHTKGNTYSRYVFNMSERIDKCEVIEILPELYKKKDDVEVVSKFQYNLNRILYGAPGTGKTYNTIEIAVDTAYGGKVNLYDRKDYMNVYNSLVEKGRIVFTTFHQGYGYEDFIQGIRPSTQNGKMKFESVDGVFKAISDKARKDICNNYVIIIDEINRANISKVFGELITLIEPDKRWGNYNQLSVRLTSGEEFTVPNNLYIVGTMNTADKSISLIDVALRRRFEFIEFPPNPELVTNEKLRNILVKLNKKLRDDFGSSDLLIGHAFFIDKSESDLVNIMNKKIIPLLYEYYFDKEEKVKAVVEDSLVDTDITIIESSLGRIVVK